MKYEVINQYIVFSAKDDINGKKEYALKKGDLVELPENDVTVRALLVRKQIKVAEETPAGIAGGKKK